MHLPRILIPCLLAAPLGFAQEVVLNSYEVGGAGGSVTLGTETDSTKVGFGLGGSVGGLVELDGAAIARLGFWGTTAPSIPVSVPARAISGASIRATASGARLLLDFQTPEAVDASVRIVGVDGRTVAPIWTRRLAPGATREAISLDAHEGQALFVLVEAGAQRKVWQFHPVTR